MAPVRRYLTLVLLALTLGAAALATVILQGDSRDSADVGTATSDKTDANDAQVTDLVPATLPAVAEDTRMPAEVQVETPQHNAAYEHELEEAHWVEGRVLLPEGTPLGERIVVEARGRRFEEGPLHSAVVAADGTFRVAFSSPTRMGELSIKARYLYLDDAEAFDPAAPPDSIVLEPKLGGHIVGTVKLPTPRLGESWDLAEVKIYATTFEQTGSRSWSGSTPRSAVITPDLTFEIGGLRPTSRCSVECDPEFLTPATIEGIEIRPGEDTACDIVLRRGVRVRGKVVDTSGAPLSRARVSASSEGNAFDSSADRNANTGDDGLFEVRGLAPGRIRIEATVKGATPGVFTVKDMKDGEEALDVEIVIGSGLELTGTVTWPDGTPAESATVEVSWARSQVWGPGETEKLSVRSQEDGRFWVVGLEDRLYDLRVRALTKRDSETGERTTMYAKREHVRPGTDLVLELTAGHELVGRVVDDRGVPVTECSITAEPADLDDWRIRDGRRRSTRVDSEAGAFVLTELDSGPWRIEANTPEGISSVPIGIEIPSGDAEVTITLPRPASVEGKVLDPSGHAVADAFLEMKWDNSTRSFFSNLDSRTTQDGHFTIAAVQPGKLRISAVKEGFARSGQLALELHPAQHLEGLVLTLGAGGIIAGELVGVEEVASRKIVVFGEGEHHETRTDESGRFRIEGVSPGTWHLGAPAIDGSLSEIDEEDWAARQTVTVVEGETVNVRLGNPTADALLVYGRAVLGDAPVAGVRITVVSGDGSWNSSWSCSTNEDGNYEVQVDGAGEYWFMIASEALGYQTYRQETIPPGESFRLDVVVPLGAISGTVFGPNGAPLPGVTVTSTVAGEFGSVGRASTDTSGAYTVRVASGTWSVQAGSREDNDAGAAYARVSRGGITVVAGKAVTGVDLHLTLGGILEGRVVDANGIGAARAQVHVSGAGGPLASNGAVTMTGHNGGYTAQGLTPGEVKAIALTPTGFVATGSAVVTSGTVTKLDLRLIPATMLAVEVVDSSGPVANAQVEVWSLDGLQIPNGFFNSEVGVETFGVPPGSYTVIANRGEKSARTTIVVPTGPPQSVQLVLGN